MGERLVIVGGAGFVGSSLAIGLKSEFPQRDIVCLDNLRRRGSELNLPRLRDHGIRFVHGDVRTSTDLDVGALGVPEVVIDCSAEPSVLAGVTSPQYVLQTNLAGTINILEFCRTTGARLLFLSTSRVYSISAIRRLRLVEQSTRFCLAPEQCETGASAAGISERFSIEAPRSLYGASKLASEMLIEEYRESFQLKAIINRCGVLTGPWQMGKVDQGVFVLWMAAHYFQKQLEYVGFGGKGKQVRDLLHIDDLLQLVKYELDHFDSLDGEVFNVGGGYDFSLSLLETTDLCRQISGQVIDIASNAAERPSDIALYISDNAKVTLRTGWSPQRSPEHTLRDIHVWITEHEPQLRRILS